MSPVETVRVLRAAEELIVPCRDFLSPQYQMVYRLNQGGRECVASMSVGDFLYVTHQAHLLGQIYADKQFAPGGEQVLANAVGVPLRFGNVTGMEPFTLYNEHVVIPQQ